MDGVSGQRPIRPSPAENHWEQLYQRATAALPWEPSRTPVEFAEWASLLAPGSSVLDLGCGRGDHAVAMARHGFQVAGIDFSATAIAAAREKATASGVDDIRFEVANLLDYRSESTFDLVYDYSVFHHVDVSNRAAYARTVSLAVRPGGLFAIVCYADDDPAAEGGGQRVGTLGNVIHHPTRHELWSLFHADFAVRSNKATRLGRRENHLAHHVIFQRVSSA
ncbi:methyltransferase domain-containing protein [Acrocarpospora sp. B8E8]|uniref:SAM-dependent methyltransferase n=1 Tax=Acrocarpospora sp. B8E8 TaxID=3153572 RepID=UPI00325C572F